VRNKKKMNAKSRKSRTKEHMVLTLAFLGERERPFFSQKRMVSRIRFTGLAMSKSKPNPQEGGSDAAQEPPEGRDAFGPPFSLA